jgi:hypothetical protein
MCAVVRSVTGTPVGFGASALVCFKKVMLKHAL